MGGRGRLLHLCRGSRAWGGGAIDDRRGRRVQQFTRSPYVTHLFAITTKTLNPANLRMQPAEHVTCHTSQSTRAQVANLQQRERNRKPRRQSEFGALDCSPGVNGRCRQCAPHSCSNISNIEPLRMFHASLTAKLQQP